MSIGHSICPLDPLDHWTYFPIYGHIPITGTLAADQHAIGEANTSQDMIFPPRKHIEMPIERSISPWVIHLSIRSTGPVKCPMDIRVSKGSIESNGHIPMAKTLRDEAKK